MTGVQTCALPICFPVTIPVQIATVFSIFAICTRIRTIKCFDFVFKHALFASQRFRHFYSGAFTQNKRKNCDCINLVWYGALGMDGLVGLVRYALTSLSSPIIAVYSLSLGNGITLFLCSSSQKITP